MNRDLNPQPRVWPQCPLCKTAYVLRRALVFSAKLGSKKAKLAGEWLWQRDCKHRNAAPEAGGVLRVRAKRR